MALNKNFYKTICYKEQNWINMLDRNLLNIYYLPELRQFYFEKQEQLNYEVNLTGNEFLKNILLSINQIIEKIDYLMNQDKKGNHVNIKELRDLFFINKLTNNITSSNKTNIETKKNNLYELRMKQFGEEYQDYTDDDFYYENKKVV